MTAISRFFVSEFERYKFTAKEYDEETGLYYYGARYYDAKLSRWCSADQPLARGDYLPVPPVNDKAKERNSNLPGMGGVFNSINLDAYHYAGDNPVKMVDPDGNAVHVLVGAVVGGVVNAFMVGFFNDDASWGDVTAAFVIGAGTGALAAGTMGASLLGDVLIGAGIGGLNSVLTQAATSDGEVNLGAVIGSTVFGGVGGGIANAFGKLVQTALTDDLLISAWKGLGDAGISLGTSAAGDYVVPPAANASENFSNTQPESMVIDRARGDAIMSNTIDAIMKNEKKSKSTDGSGAHLYYNSKTGEIYHGDAEIKPIPYKGK